MVTNTAATMELVETGEKRKRPAGCPVVGGREMR
jgi:hypothetical protein